MSACKLVQPYRKGREIKAIGKAYENSHVLCHVNKEIVNSHWSILILLIKGYDNIFL